jgi:hypothetical protein
VLGVAALVDAPAGALDERSGARGGALTELAEVRRTTRGATGAAVAGIRRRVGARAGAGNFAGAAGSRPAVDHGIRRTTAGGSSGSDGRIRSARSHAGVDSAAATAGGAPPGTRRATPGALAARRAAAGARLLSGVGLTISAHDYRRIRAAT